MSEYASSIDVEQQVFERQSIVYQGYAQSLLFSEAGPRTTAADCLMIAAIYRSIFDQEAALPVFGQAMLAYYRAGDSRWKLMAVCSQDVEYFPPAAREFNPPASPTEAFRELVLQSFLSADRRNPYLDSLINLIEGSPLLQTSLVGRAKTPLRFYVAVMSNPNDFQASALTEVFQRNEDLLLASMAYRRHWRNQINMLPYEPEMLAFLVALSYQNTGPWMDEFKSRYSERFRSAYLIDLTQNLRSGQYTL